MHITMVEKDELIRLYACCRQAQMSLHRVLPFGDVWAELQAFYSQRIQSLQAMLENLRKLAPPDGAPSRAEIERSARWLPFLRPLRSLANGRRAKLSMSARYLAFVRASLERFSAMLDRPTRPATEEIIEMRRELHASEWILQLHLCGVKEAADAELVEHFNQSDYRRHVALEDAASSGPRLEKRSA